VHLEGRYDIVPTEVADKIRARDASCVVTLRAPASEVVEEDPYKEFPVPDDLMW